MAHLQQHARLLAPAGVLALQVKIEELALKFAAVVGVEMRPVFDSVRLEPLVLRGGAREAFEIAARMQALSAPVRRREQRHGDLVPLRRSRLVIIIVERMCTNVGAEIAAVLGKLFFAERFRPAHQLPCTRERLPRLARTARSSPACRTSWPKGRQHAAMMPSRYQSAAPPRCTSRRGAAVASDATG